MESVTSIAARMIRIRTHEPRLKFPEGFERSFTMQSHATVLFPLLERMVPAIAAVENMFEQKFGIMERFPVIEIELPQRFIKNMVCIRLNPARAVYSLGDPNSYDAFFDKIEISHAHETGHLLSFFSGKGKFRYRDLTRNREVDLGFLASQGSVPYFYLTGVDFGLFPIGLLNHYSKGDAYYWINELIAHRVEEQALGSKIDRPSIAENIQIALEDPSPWVRVFHLALADVNGLKKGVPELEHSLRWWRHLPWRSQLTTNDLRERMSQFYGGIEIVNRK